MQLKDRLRELRGNTTQRECAAKLGVKFTNYNKWEQGAIPNLETLVHIANYYNVTLDYLAGRTDFKNPDYQQTTIETGLTENALKGLAKIKESSEDENNVNILDVLNYLLEKELESDVQENLQELQFGAKYAFLFELFPAAFIENYPSSLSALLFYIGKVDGAVHDDFYATIRDIKGIVREFPETTDSEKCQKNLAETQLSKLNGIVDHFEENSLFNIPNILLPVLRLEYINLDRQHPKGFYKTNRLGYYKYSLSPSELESIFSSYSENDSEQPSIKLKRKTSKTDSGKISNL